MKRLLFIIELLFLSILSAFTQDKIDKPTFEKIVDYANCKYLMRNMMLGNHTLKIPMK